MLGMRRVMLAAGWGAGRPARLGPGPPAAATHNAPQKRRATVPTWRGALPYAEAEAAEAARSGAGVRAAATITIRKAEACSTRPSGSEASGSPKTRMPPAIAETFAAAAVSVITG